MANSNNSVDQVYSYIKAIVLTIVYLASLYEAQAQVHLVKDINTKPQSSYWNSTGVRAGNIFYFTAYTNEYGVELWRSDGTASGTTLIKDINAGSKDSSPQRLTVLNNIVYFTADDGMHGTELWRSDGTAAGTYLLKETEEGSDASVILGMVATNSYVYFHIHNNNRSYLWKTDGSETTPVIDMGYIQNLTGAGDAVYFSGDGSGEAELWRSEGTEETTGIVSDVSGSNVNSGPGNLTYVNGILYFTSYTTAAGVELWKTDGTYEGTEIVANIMDGSGSSSPSNLTVSGNKLYFIADHLTYGRELWVTDGTATSLVKNISDAVQSTEFGEMIGANGSLYFVAKNFLGSELWFTNGTAEGTYTVANIAGGSASSNPSGFTATTDFLFFRADDNERGVELWKSDGTTEGTTIVKDIYEGDSSNPQGLFSLNDNVYFWADDGAHGKELWASKPDGETVLLKDIATGTDFSDISDITTDGTNTWFIESNTGIWRTDGTEAGTVNILEHMNLQYRHLLKTDKALYGVLRADELDAEKIIHSDGSGEMISLHNANFMSINWLKEVDGVLYFAAEEPGHGMELWKSNGVFDDITLAADINPGSGGSFPTGAVVYNGDLYFRADDGSHGSELWRYKNGVAEMVKDINPGASHSSPNDLVVNGGKIYFSATTTDLGQELWVSDGTADGTHVVKDINPGNAWGNPFDLVAWNDILYFIANDGQHAFELWRSDGTEAGTWLVKDVDPSSDYISTPDYLTPYKGALYFTAKDGDHGYELWKTDGTEEGTQLVKDITPGEADTELYWFTVFNDRLFFVAGNTIWITNGNECGTMPLLHDPAVRYYDGFAPVGAANKLYFMATSDEAGAELYYYDLSSMEGLGCAQTITFEDIPAKTIIDAPFELHATASSSLPVVFESTNQNVIRINGNVATIVGAGETSITASQPGNADFNAATPAVKTVLVAAITGVGENADKKISIYPNPVTDFVMVDVSDAVINLLNINGQAVASAQEDNKLDVRGLPPGIYIVRVTTKDLTVSKRIIKK